MTWGIFMGIIYLPKYIVLDYTQKETGPEACPFIFDVLLNFVIVPVGQFLVLSVKHCRTEKYNRDSEDRYDEVETASPEEVADHESYKYCYRNYPVNDGHF